MREGRKRWTRLREEERGAKGRMGEGGENLEAHVREKIAKVATVMGQIWDIGKSRFGRKWKRRVWLYDTLIW